MQVRYTVGPTATNDEFAAAVDGCVATNDDVIDVPLATLAPAAPPRGDIAEADAAAEACARCTRTMR